MTNNLNSKQVSILVLMDVGLKHRRLGRSSDQVQVSILVLMDVGLKPLKSSNLFVNEKKVSILVLMDVGLKHSP